MIADLDSEAGLMLVKEALLSLRSEAGQIDETLSRFTFIHNPATIRRTIQRSPSSLLAHLIITGTIQKATPVQLLHVLGLVEIETSQESIQMVIPQNNVLDELLAGTVMSGSGSDMYDHFIRSSEVLVKLLKLAPGDQALVVNGRVSRRPI